MHGESGQTVCAECVFRVGNFESSVAGFLTGFEGKNVPATVSTNSITTSVKNAGNAIALMGGGMRGEDEG